MTHKKYSEIFDQVSNALGRYDLLQSETFIDKIVHRVDEDADKRGWSTDDIIIAIRNQLNEMIENL